MKRRGVLQNIVFAGALLGMGCASAQRTEMNNDRYIAQCMPHTETYKGLPKEVLCGTGEKNNPFVIRAETNRTVKGTGSIGILLSIKMKFKNKQDIYFLLKLSANQLRPENRQALENELRPILQVAARKFLDENGYEVKADRIITFELGLLLARVSRKACNSSYLLCNYFPSNDKSGENTVRSEKVIPMESMYAGETRKKTKVKNEEENFTPGSALGFMCEGPAEITEGQEIWFGVTLGAM